MLSVLDLTRALVRCDSVTPRDAGALGVIEEALKSLGFVTHRVTFSEPGHADIDNLYARLGSEGPTLCFAGHTDVVPAGDDTAWTHGPFAGDVADGTLYGRGTVDMKGAIAAAIAATARHLDAHGRPKGSIAFLITGDEEGIAVNGTVKLLKWAEARGERFDHCIVGEPSNIAALGDCIKIGRRGSLNGTLTVAGKQGHVAYPERADNPVRGMVALVNALMAAPLDAGTPHFDPSNLEVTSVDVGNPAVNVIPARATARFNIRFNDCHTPESLRALIESRLQAAAGDRIRFHVEWEPCNAEAFRTDPGPFVDLVTEAVRAVTGRMPDRNTKGGTSDARFIARHCPVLEFGLVGQTMHQVDERVAISDLDALTQIYAGVLARYFSR